MELPEEFTGSSDHFPLIKRKHPKRKPPFCPSAGVEMTYSSSTGGGRRGDLCFPLPSPTTSGANSTSKEEDEEMANCLILLAQGGKNSDLFGYDCKTCNRTFPSFQALGGHRASHKKPKTIMLRDADFLSPKHKPDEEKEASSKTTSKQISTPFSFQIETIKASHMDNKSSKVHGCSICGVVFSSGQALGGHMRRHRAPQTAQTSDGSDKSANELCGGSDKKREILSLDLNLPAPLEDDSQLIENKRNLGLSGPALVDCYY